MESKPKLAESLKMAIYNFLDKLVLVCHKIGALNDDFMKKFFTFVKSMSFCKLRCLRHTGVIFGKNVLSIRTFFKRINSHLLNLVSLNTDV